jgi:hypothetical protein
MPKFKVPAMFRRPELENANQQMAADVMTPAKAKDSPGANATICPSFESEPWQSRLSDLKTQSKDEFFLIDWNTTAITPPPLPLNHGYVKLYLEFLDTVPRECWIDEENEQD